MRGYTLARMRLEVWVRSTNRWQKFNSLSAFLKDLLLCTQSKSKVTITLKKCFYLVAYVRS